MSAGGIHRFDTMAAALIADWRAAAPGLVRSRGALTGGSHVA
jgi:hypothetical protein